MAIVINDLEGSDPPVPSGIRIYCNADTILRQRGHMDQSGHSCQYCTRINAKKKWSWGVLNKNVIQSYLEKIMDGLEKKR